MEISRTYSLPLQALVCILLAIQVIIIFLLLYLKKDFHFDLTATTSIFGWIMLIAIVILSLWNLIAYFSRNRQLKKACTLDHQQEIFKATAYVRYFTLYLITIVGLIFALITGNLYYLIFVVFSMFWQISIFPTRNTIANALVEIPISESQPIEEPLKKQSGDVSTETNTHKE